VETLDLPYKIISDVLGEKIEKNAVYLSGPSFAVEIMNSQPTMVTVASHCGKRAKWAQSVFHDPLFRVYTSEDVIGIEIAGALKVYLNHSNLERHCNCKWNLFRLWLSNEH
jgi:glycerol-3-phosphate dehydrogenase